MSHSYSHKHQPEESKHNQSGHTGHAHNHSHAHGMGSGRAFFIGIILNSVFVLVEFGVGLGVNSMALVADAGHNLSDVLGLIFAWGAAALARKSATNRFTYGYRKSTILAALLNASLLLIAVGGIAWESVERLTMSVPTAGGTVIVVASVGIVLNAATALLFYSGRHHDLNVKGAYLHMVADALVSLGVVISGGIMFFTGWHWIDAITGIAIAVLIAWGSWGLLRDSARLALDGVPGHIAHKEVLSFLQGLSGVSDVHHIHIWAMSTTEAAMTAHLVVPDGRSSDELHETIRNALKERFAISHVTLQVERTKSEHCSKSIF